MRLSSGGRALLLLLPRLRLLPPPQFCRPALLPPWLLLLLARRGAALATSCRCPSAKRLSICAGVGKWKEGLGCRCLLPNFNAHSMHPRGCGS